MERPVVTHLICSLLLTALLTYSAREATAATAGLEVGKYLLEVNIPDNFADACAELEIRKLFASDGPTGSKLLGCFIEEQELAQFPDFDPATVANPILQVRVCGQLRIRSIA